jgi:hypothetical protein
MDDQEELTPEQAAERAHYEAMESFACDVRNIRFVENRENWAKLMEFLTDQDLPVTAPNLRFAFLALTRKNELELMPLGQLQPPQPQQPEPTPAAQPAPLVPITARSFRMYRNGQPISGGVRSL